MKELVELRRMSDEQLKDRIQELDASFFRLKGYSKAGGAQASNPHMMKSLRKNKARCLTILRERELKKHAKVQ